MTGTGYSTGTGIHSAAAPGCNHHRRRRRFIQMPVVKENEIADNMYQRSELDWLIYKKPLEYAQPVLCGELDQYVQGTPEQRLMD